jgi:hypothetical protein
LDEKITEDDIDNLMRKTTRKREKYLEFQYSETTRGMIYVRGIFSKYYSPIIYEEVYAPRSSFINKKKSVLTRKTRTSELPFYPKLVPKSHLIFLLHGFMGKDEDMEKVNNVILQR